MKKKKKEKKSVKKGNGDKSSLKKYHIDCQSWDLLPLLH